MLGYKKSRIDNEPTKKVFFGHNIISFKIYYYLKQKLSKIQIKRLVFYSKVKNFLLQLKILIDIYKKGKSMNKQLKWVLKQKRLVFTCNKYWMLFGADFIPA